MTDVQEKIMDVVEDMRLYNHVDYKVHFNYVSTWLTQGSRVVYQCTSPDVRNTHSAVLSFVEGMKCALDEMQLA